MNNGTVFTYFYFTNKTIGTGLNLSELQVDYRSVSGKCPWALPAQVPKTGGGRLYGRCFELPHQNFVWWVVTCTALKKPQNYQNQGVGTYRSMGACLGQHSSFHAVSWVEASLYFIKATMAAAHFINLCFGLILFLFLGLVLHLLSFHINL